MKKKNVLIILVLSVALLLGCTDITSDKVSDEKSAGKSAIGSGEMIQGSFASVMYLYFEDYFGHVNSIILGQYVSRVSTYKKEVEYTFRVLNNVKGVDPGETITVTLDLPDYQINEEGLWIETPENHYETGKTYLLLLERYSSVYNTEDQYYFCAPSLILPIDNTATLSLDSSKCLLYDTSLENHFRTEETRLAYKNNTLSKYIIEKTKSNSDGHEMKYVHSEDVGEVVRQSDYIVRVTIDRLDLIGSAESEVNPFWCTVSEVLKGEISQKSIGITVLTKQVTIGEEYVIALFPIGEPGTSHFYISSHHSSVFPISEYEKIKAMIASE